MQCVTDAERIEFGLGNSALNASRSAGDKLRYRDVRDEKAN
jgi:hypothetical protein